MLINKYKHTAEELIALFKEAVASNERREQMLDRKHKLETELREIREQVEDWQGGTPEMRTLSDVMTLNNLKILMVDDKVAVKISDRIVIVEGIYALQTKEQDGNCI